MASVCHLSIPDAEQEAMVALTKCVESYGDSLNAGMVAISTRNHMLHIAEMVGREKRKGVSVRYEDTHPSSELSPEQLAIASDTEERISDACETLGMSPERTVATSVVLHTLSSRKYQTWIAQHPEEWGYWLSAADMSPARAVEIGTAEAKRLFTRLIVSLRSAKQ
jgi:hypothetical protein